MVSTEHYGLSKQEYEDRPDIEPINENFDAIDRVLKTLSDELGAKAAQADFAAHDDDAVRHVTAAERTAWNAKETPGGAQAKVDTHANRTDNPHGVTPGQIGAETPAGAQSKAAAAAAAVQSNLTTHTGDKTNPHAVTKAQVGLANVTDNQQATKAEFDTHNGDSTRHITAGERTAWNGAVADKHTHANKGVLDKITQALLDAWDSAVSHISDAVRHITAQERTAWDAKETPVGAQTKANAAEANAKAYADGIKPTKVSQLANDKDYVTQSELGTAGYGDMLKTVYDTNGDGKVNAADNADKLGGQLPAYYAKQADLTSHAGDTAKHITTAERAAWNDKQAALGYTPENAANKGAANGYAGLGADGKVPAGQLPAMGVGADHLTDYLPHGIMAAATTITYSGENISTIDVKAGTVLKTRTTLTYSGENVTSVNVRKYAADGSTVEREYTDTITYSGENVTGVTRVVNK